MSNPQPNSGRPVDDIEEAEEAFIDLDDPNLEVLDESNLPPIDEEDEDANEEGSAADAERDDQDPAQQQPGDAAAPPEQDAEFEDLNAVPDHEPERDDAWRTFVSAGEMPVHAVAAHPTRRTVFATSGEAEKVFIVDAAADEAAVKLLHSLEGHTDTVSLLAFSPNGEWLASGSLDGTIGVWSTTTWERSLLLNEFSGEILTLLWHPSSLVLVAGATDAQAAMWNALNGTMYSYFVGHRGSVTCTVWTPDYKKLMTGSSDASISVFSPKTGEQEVNISKDLSPDNAEITTMCFVNDDQCVVGCYDGTLHVFSLGAKKVVAHFEELHEQAIETLLLNPSSTFLLSTSCDCKVIIWNVRDFSARTVINVGESVIPALWFNTNYLVVGCSDGAARVWDGRSGQQEPLVELQGHRRMILSVVQSDDVIATASDDGRVKFFRISDLNIAA